MTAALNAENFRCFCDRQEISLISSGRVHRRPDHAMQIGPASLLRSAAIYGANASGKSTPAGVLAFLPCCMEGGIPADAVHDFCRLGRENAARPSRFGLRFPIGARFCAYGSAAVLYERRIMEERLYELLPGGRAAVLFSREAGKAPALGSEVPVSREEAYRFQVYAEDFGGHDSILFLPEMNRNQNDKAMPDLLFFRDVFTALTQNLVLRSPDARVVPLYPVYDQNIHNKFDGQRTPQLLMIHLLPEKP